MVGLGVGGLWPNGIALVSECWSNASRPIVSGAMMAGLNVGILILSQLVRLWPITPDSWHWVFRLSGAPALLGLIVLLALPESPAWLAARGAAKQAAAPLRELFSSGMIRATLVGIVLSSIPMIGAWAASKWMIPWADKIAGEAHAGYKAATQGWWALGATLGSVMGSQLASWLGRRASYFLYSIGATIMTIAMFRFTAPLQAGFHAVVFVQGIVATLFFGWLALFLPELYPTRVRATGSGLAYNSGRFATAIGVLAAGMLFGALGGDYPRVGTSCAFIYALGVIFIWCAPVTAGAVDGE
jgi:MFS family permease